MTDNFKGTDLYNTLKMIISNKYILGKESKYIFLMPQEFFQNNFLKLTLNT